jgi:hypothetical protein
MSFREEIRERSIHLAASDERNGIADVGAALDVAGRDRLETADTHSHTGDGGVNRKEI